jgi:hypothetical protein
MKSSWRAGRYFPIFPGAFPQSHTQTLLYRHYDFHTTMYLNVESLARYRYHHRLSARLGHAFPMVCCEVFATKVPTMCFWSRCVLAGELADPGGIPSYVRNAGFPRTSE